MTIEFYAMIDVGAPNEKLVEYRYEQLDDGERRLVAYNSADGVRIGRCYDRTAEDMQAWQKEYFPNSVEHINPCKARRWLRERGGK